MEAKKSQKEQEARTNQTTGYGKVDGADGKSLSMLSIAPTVLKHFSDNN
ncbi:hypothetical protein SMSP2_01113 [Limihaloglobus sulfuriphilus]|uniref:Uncharacterized protein n=1 Tax=Limihaloglobus sulfuriphilus TaxID=1851148 RepID=A0A1Q2MET0_9BACT|nr:hypothetical protein [Limihaloglobus sulfuriphilus]AQQ70752.1 hypothetical protein SMSP2_01113 [Limihaloglobus sulfuriphilus]